MNSATAMKIVQAGILACLLVLSGLVYGIYQRQAAPPEVVQTARERSYPVESVHEPPQVFQLSPALFRRAARPRPRPIRSVPGPRLEAEPEAVERDVLAVVEPLEAASRPAPPPPAPQAEAASEPARVPPRRVTVESGTRLVIRLAHTLSTERNQPGDDFTAALDEPLIVDGLVLADRGAQVEGRIVESRRAGRVKGSSFLSCELVRLRTDDAQWLDLSTSQVEREGPGQRKDDMKKVVLGAGVGAIIGALGGGGKGAAIGAGIGGGAGAGAAAAKRGKPVVLRPETRLTFFLNDSINVVEQL